MLNTMLLCNAIGDMQAQQREDMQTLSTNTSISISNFYNKLFDALTAYQFSKRIDLCDIEIAKAEDYGKGSAALRELREQFVKEENDYYDEITKASAARL